MNNLVIFLILIPLVASSFSLLNRYFPRLRIAEAASFGALILCLIFLGLLFQPLLKQKVINYPVGGWQEPLGINLYMDGLAWGSSLMGMTIALLALIFAWGEKKYRYNFYFFFLILIAGMEGVILTGDLFNMFVFFEILSIASYILIAYSRERKSILASFNYLLISSLGMGFFLLAIFLLYQQTGILSLREIAYLQLQTKGNLPVFNLAIISLIVGIGVKAAFIPLHTWLPDAHAFAPHPVSAILSGVMIKVSFLSIWRILRLFQAIKTQQIFLWIGAITAFMAVIWAIAQDDSKKLLAYHSISQMGFIIASFGVATSLSLAASFYHLLNHSLFKSLLFLSIGCVICSMEERDIQKLSGLGRKMPFVFLAFMVGALSICGIPPFNGYVSKNLISLSLKEHPLAYYLIFLASIGTVASFTKLSQIFRKDRAKRKNQGKEEASASRLHQKKLSRGMLIPLGILSILCILTGILPHLWTAAISKLITGEELRLIPVVYSLSSLTNSVFILGLGFALYLGIRSSLGQRILKYIRGLKLGLNNSLFLLVGGFLFLIFLGWIMEKGL